jgi:uncharacterized SAM-binding protein YcdF (DUF218 family)
VAHVRPPSRFLDPAIRGFALFIGALAVANGVRALCAPAGDAGLDANSWWIDLRPLGPTPATLAMTGAGVVLAAWALRAAGPRVLRRGAAMTAAALAVVTLANGVGVLRLVADGRVDAGPVPLSFGLAAALLAVAWTAWREPPEPARRVSVLIGAAAWAVIFPCVQMASFGRSDYRRDADAIVVFGARTYRDGTASLALADRVRTGAALWREGRAPVLFLSGGPGDGAVHETEAMRRLAREAGVPDDAIVLDRSGVNSRATVVAAAAWIRARGCRRLLAVSHAYHLPRVRMEFDRAGVDAFTVPAEESRILGKMPWFVAREVAAWWVAWAGS